MGGGVFSGANPELGDVVIFFVFFFHVSGIQGFLGFVPAPQDRKSCHTMYSEIRPFSGS